MDTDDSMFDMMSDGSDFDAVTTKTKTKAPKAPKPSAKTAAKKAAAPKPKANPKPKSTIPKKRAKAQEDEEDESSRGNLFDDEPLLVGTPPPQAKKAKITANIAKSPHSKPLAEIVNENMAADGDSPKVSRQKRVSEQYQRMTQLEHIIRRPDTYIGSTENTEKQMWVYNSETSSMEFREVSYVPGLFKIFDEILVNAADNKQNDKHMKFIKVTINRDKGEVSVENDGKGIPIEIHSKEKMYIPELIFGNLLTGSNYNDAEQKVTGGRNGYGAKLCNIFSTEFTIETVDSNLKKKYKQTWTKNMSEMAKAKITDFSKGDSYTKITFKPDYGRFGMDAMDNDHESLFKRRVYDLAGTCRGVKVYLNGAPIPVKNFKQYIEMYTKAIKKERGEEAKNDHTEIITETPDVRWEIGFTVSDGSFQQVSFVNSIATTSGGTHVNYVADQITNKLAEVVKKKNKNGPALKLNQIRNHIFVFVNCLIVNPAFNSQTKEQLTTKTSQFGSKCTISDEFIKKVLKTEVITNIMSFAQQKADQILKKSDGSRRSRMHDPKLTDANKAGTKDGHKCTLILTEGDSAKGMAMAGRAVVGADLFGVFPLRGKLLNVRDASIDQISKNKEIQNIKNFLGLQHKKVYTDAKGLRYGHLMIMTDQDHDGSHIKGLLINFLQVQFPSLLKIPNFLVEFITPIIKVWKGDARNPTKVRAFFTMPEYFAWREAHKGERWEFKYYKGLGTSSTEESQEYFNDIDKHHKEFEVMKDEETALIELAFSKKKADERKEWLRQFKPGTFFDYSVEKITYSDFINKELILFSMADNIRSIPSVIDGFKPTQRKVLYTCFRRNIKKDIKVFELSGLVSTMTAYHHGDASMQQTIVGLAQTFVGSNNVNCLEPAGQFGTRLEGGSDAASARYIFTRPSAFARKLFNAADEPLLTYNTDEGKQIEPEVYVPVVPMILINGSEGIGTGWSTQIPNFNPEDIVDNLKRRMKGEEFHTMQPWFRGFKGPVNEAGPDRFKFSGIIKQTGDNEIEITELPVRVWTQDFKEKLEEIIKAEKGPSFIKDYEDHNTHKDVHFIIKMDEKHMKSALEEGLEDKFKLTKTLGTTNLVAFDPEGRITKYSSVLDIMEEFYAYRLRFYQMRKDHMLKTMEQDLKRFTNQARFIKMIIDGKLSISRKKKAVLIAELKKLGFDAYPKKEDASKAGEMEALVQEEEDDADEDPTIDSSAYDYLLGMPLWSLTQERVERLQRHIGEKEAEIDALLQKTKEELWNTDLDEFISEWRFQLEDERNRERNIRKGRRASKKFATGKSSRKANDDDAYEDFKPSKPKKAIPGAKKDTQAKLSNFVRKTQTYVPKPASQPSKPLSLMTPEERSGYLMRKFAKTDGASDDLDDPSEGSASKTGSKAQIPKRTKPTEIKHDVESDEDVPMVMNKPSRATTSKKQTYQDLSDSDSNGDSLLANLGNMVKGLPVRSEDGITATKPSSSSAKQDVAVGSKPSKKNLKPLATDDDDDLLMSDAPPPAKKEPDVFDLSDDDDDESIVKASRKPVPVKKSAVTKAKTVTKAPAKKAQEKKTTQSPMAKAYAKRLAKKTSDSDDEVDAMADDLLDSPVVSEDEEPTRKPASRPARRAAAPSKKVYDFGISDDDDEGFDDNDEESALEGFSDDDED